MTVVRHGLMLVGESYGMKTSTYRTLAAALTGNEPTTTVC
jgi:dynein heavy chain